MNLPEALVSCMGIIAVTIIIVVAIVFLNPKAE